MPFRNAILPVLVFLFLFAGSVSAQSMPPAGPVQPPALTALNNAFRAAYPDEVAGSRKFPRSALLGFTRSMAPLVMQNVKEATRAQLDAIHAQVSAWRRELSPKEWNELHVLIIGPHMPREDLVVTQYFL